MNRRPGNPLRPGGVTLVELLVVIVLIATMMALLLPVVGSIRESARRTSCSNNLRQLGVGVMNYVSQRQYFPWATNIYEPRHGFIAQVLPFLDESSVYDALDLNLNWNDPVNLPATQVDLRVLVCPAAPTAASRRWISDYGVATRVANPATASNVTATRRGIRELINSGRVQSRGADNHRNWNGLLQHRFRVVGGQMTEYRITPAHCRDGLSNTMLILEDGGRPLEYGMNRRFVGPMPATYVAHRWASPENYFVLDYFCIPDTMMNCSNYDEVYSFHPEGCNFVLADGSVRFLADSIDPDLFVSLFTSAAGDQADLSGP